MKKCKFCGEKLTPGKPGVEWLVRKKNRGRKDWFHRECYFAHVKGMKYEQASSKEKTDI